MPQLGTWVGSLLVFCHAARVPERARSPEALNRQRWRRGLLRRLLAIGKRRGEERLQHHYWQHYMLYKLLLHAVWSGHNQQASSLQSMLNFFRGLLRKRGEKILSSFALGGGTCSPCPPSSYTSVCNVVDLYELILGQPKFEV